MSVSFEVSDSFTPSNLLSSSATTTTGGTINIPGIGPDNGGPDDEDSTPIYSVKFETDDSNGDILDFNIVLTSDRAPIWSDIFFKTGQIGMTNSGYLLADPVVGGANPMTTGNWFRVHCCTRYYDSCTNSCCCLVLWFCTDWSR